jgi:hypothetical protein
MAVLITLACSISDEKQRFNVYHTLDYSRYSWHERVSYLNAGGEEWLGGAPVYQFVGMQCAAPAPHERNMHYLTRRLLGGTKGAARAQLVLLLIPHRTQYHWGAGCFALSPSSVYKVAQKVLSARSQPLWFRALAWEIVAHRHGQHFVCMRFYRPRMSVGRDFAHGQTSRSNFVVSCEFALWCNLGKSTCACPKCK